jgi:hypothetical protein
MCRAGLLEVWLNLVRRERSALASEFDVENNRYLGHVEELQLSHEQLFEKFKNATKLVSNLGLERRPDDDYFILPA